MERAVSTSGLTPTLARVLPFAAYIGLLVAAGWFPDPFWAYAARIVVVTGLLVFFARHYIELQEGAGASWKAWLLSAATGAGVFVAWIHLDVPWLSFGLSGSFVPTTASGSVDWAVAGLRLFGAAAVVPVMEELFWRSFILRSVDRSDFLSLPPVQATLKALVVSSLLFGFEHQLWFAGVIAGLAYGWLYMRTGNLWVAVFAHAVTNLLLGVWIILTGNWQFW